MKMKKMLAGLSALVLSASVCAVSVPANAGIDQGMAEAYKNIINKTAQENASGTYTLYDLDEDGVLELVLCFGFGSSEGEYGIYTYENGEAVTFSDTIGFLEAKTLSFNPSNHILVEYAGASSGIFTELAFLEINGRNVTVKDMVSCERTDGGYIYYNVLQTEAMEDVNSIISKEEYDNILSKYNFSSLSENGYTVIGQDYSVTDLSPLDVESTETVTETTTELVTEPETENSALSASSSAVRLAKAQTSEIAEIMGNTYAIENMPFDGVRYFYNNDIFPNVIFGISTSDDYEYDTENAKTMIKNDTCDFQCVRSIWNNKPQNFAITDKINSSFDYNQCAEVLGDFDCKMTQVWTSGDAGEMGYEFKNNGCIVRLYFDLEGDYVNASKVYTASELKNINPEMTGFEVVPDPDAQQETTEETETSTQEETPAQENSNSNNNNNSSGNGSSGNSSGSSSSKSSTSSSSSNSTSSGSTSATASPATSDQFPAAAGLAALAALTAGIFTRRKNK